jgi:3-methyladenine DNA glycosylase Mpg
MVNKDFFERSSMAVAEDLGLRTLRFSKEGSLYVPEATKEVLITRTVAYGTERGYEPKKTRKGELKKSVQAGFNEPGIIDMYWTGYGYTLAISTGKEGEFSEISIHGGFPLSGFEEQAGNLDQLLNGPIKLTRNFGIDREVAQALHGAPIYDNKMIEIGDDKLPGTYVFDEKKISNDALGSFNFKIQ